MSFPTSLPTYTEPSASKTLDEDNHTQRHKSVQDDTVALAGKVGVDGSMDTNSMDYKLNSMDYKLNNFSTSTDTLTNKDLSDSSNTFPDFYPVGTQYVNLSNSANPSTYLPGQSASTWVANSGTVTVAKAAAGTFATAGATGGMETTNHAGYAPGLNTGKFQDTGQTYLASMEGDINTYLADGGSSSISRSTTVRAKGGTLRTDGTASTEVGHYRYTTTNLQPWKVKYVWDRVS